MPSEAKARKSNWKERAETLAPYKMQPLSEDEETVVVPPFRCPKSLKERLEAAPGGTTSEKLRKAVEFWLQSLDSEQNEG